MTFADDTKIYREIKFSNDCASLQEDFDSLSARSADSELSLNETKCKVETITRKKKKKSSEYNLNLEIENDIYYNFFIKKKYLTLSFIDTMVTTD